MDIPPDKIEKCLVCDGLAVAVRHGNFIIYLVIFVATLNLKIFSRIYLGVPSCFQCSKFYLRVIYKERKKPVCKRENQCPLEKNLKRMCAGCRYARFESLVEKVKNQNK